MNKKGVRSYTRPIAKIIFNFLDVVFHFLFRLAYGKTGKKAPPINDLLLLESATSIALKIRTKKIKCIDILESYINRLRDVNPLLNCMVANRFDEARDEAKKCDKILESGAISEEELAKSKPFFGVPFTTKDCIAVQGMIHSSGLVKRKNVIASEDGDCIRLLKNAGAIPIALSNVSELCMWWESSNKVHGRTSNPYDTNHIVGGSSGGEGCLQAIAGSAFGVGSDIGGSIRMPCVFNGIFGHKPTASIVSIKGQYPVPTTDEQKSYLGIGPMCRRAEDLMPLLKIMAGNNALKLRLDEAVDIKNVRMFYQEDDGGSAWVSRVNSEIKGLFDKVKVHFEKAHNQKVRKLELQRFSKGISIWFAGMSSEDGPSFKRQLANLEGSINPLLELLKWSVGLSEHTFIGIGTALFEGTTCKNGDEKYMYLLEEKEAFKRELQDILGDDGVLLYPTHPTPAPYHNEPLFKPFNFSYTAVVNLLGFPSTHIPMGLDSEGLPIGLQAISAPNNDRYCLAVARELEKAFGGWVPFTE